jgi:hypothetical protein
MRALHLIQHCMVYINTRMIQKVLSQQHGQGRLTPRAYAALTPWICEHVNPYGRFDLDLNARPALLRSKWRLMTRVLGLPLINEYRLSPMDPKARKFLEEQMEKYFFGEGAETPPDFVPQK